MGSLYQALGVTWLICASITATVAESTFAYAKDGLNITFTLAAAADNGDWFFRMSAPSKFSWIAIGTGEKMDGSMMFLAYPAADGKNITLSARQDGSHDEPIYNSKINASLIHSPDRPNGIVDAQYYIAAVCKNCSTYSREPISLTNTAQDFIFAVGPAGSNHKISSDSASFSIPRHSCYGSFRIDMTKATSPSVTAAPALGTAMSDGVSLGDELKTSDHDWASIIHAVIMCIAFVIGYPLGVFALRVMDKVMWHAWVQGAAVGLTILGTGVGLYIGMSYNRSKHINSAHQILGLFILLAVIIQFGLGFFHHRIYKATQRATKRIKVHKFVLGPLAIIIGLINGALGFNLALNQYLTVPYVVIFCIVGVVLAASIVFKLFRNRRKQKFMYLNDQSHGQLEGYDSNIGYEQGFESDVGLVDVQGRRH